MRSHSKNIPSFRKPLPIDLFLESSAGTYIYDDLRQFEHAFLYYLRKIEYNFDKPVALSSRSSDELVFIIASCWRLGISFVTIDPGLSDKEQALLLKQLSVDLLIHDQVRDSPGSAFIPVNIESFALSNILSPDFTPEEWVEKRKKNINPAQVFGYFLTSGTTGKPKIVPLKRRQMLYGAAASAQNLRLERNHLWLLSLPLHHIGGISVILRSLLYGSGIYRLKKFTAAETAELLRHDRRVSAASLVPTMLNRLMKHAGFSVHEDFQAILLGGGPIASSLVGDCFERGIPVITSYGMTESCAQIAANPLMTVGDLSRPRKSAGKIFAPNRVAVRKEGGRSAEPFERGQIWLRGPQLFDGYVNRDNTSYFDAGGWFNTGDYGYLNKQKELFIEARRTDLIVSGGENISPVEVEEALKKLQGIRDAAVAGIPDKEWGQKVVAIVTSAGSGNTDAAGEAMDIEIDIDIDGGEVRRLLKRELPSFKIPKEIRRVDSIPRTENGKIKRGEVRKFFSDNS